ncbi:MAG TPA: hypothetical protein ENJ37_06140 [Deltaproteobacteria bacterium]|nr:hypothetical protein [Deltaproteobacteria bacterium]
MSRPLLTTVVLAAALLLVGCEPPVKRVDNPALLEEHPGLDTVPVYRKGSVSFSTAEALRLAEQDRKAALEERFRGEETSSLEIPDPWIPPAYRSASSLPKALRAFPKDKFGYPDWTASVQEGIIMPRAGLLNKKVKGEYQRDYWQWAVSSDVMLKLSDSGEVKKGKEITLEDVEREIEDAPYDLDIVFEINDRLMANVLFPHKVHSYWLGCKVCHPGIFVAKKGANVFTMYDVWEGKYCGRCHGKVAFQPKGFENCQRCHKVKKKTMGIK